jgi:hypothetical protein
MRPNEFAKGLFALSAGMLIVDIVFDPLIY